MAVLKCPVCGGELDVNADLSVGVCKFCESVITIPKELDRKGNLYNRAVFLRQNNEFDKAMETYEDILKEDNSYAEAHWGLVLSKYGIEYVLDPKTQERIPTCHRTQSQSILSDPDYLAAIEYSDIEAQRVIENEANRINKIQTMILELSQKEEPYDIFICYKETDELGNRTEDSILAQELYYELKKKGYRIFFARKTLESKLGSEYEPIIFAALCSAKVMIVLGTKADHFNSVWVRNEWSRFIKLSKDTNKVIIPAYRGMSPYELPTELSTYQSQDMSKIGFLQDLTDGIERCVRGGISKKSIKEETTQSYGIAPLERLLQNGATYLKLGNYNYAEEVYRTITKEYPEEHRGWWGLIVCKTRNFSEISLDQTTLNVWFEYVKQLAAPKDFQELENQYVDYTKKVSKLAATEDMKAVNSKINEYTSELLSLQNGIQSLDVNIKKREDELNRQLSSERDAIRREEENINQVKKARFDKKKGLAIGGIELIVGVMLLFFGGWSILLGLIIGFIGFIVLISNEGETKTSSSFQTLDKRESSSRANIQKAKNAQFEYKKRFESDIAYLRKEISKQENEIAVLQNKIEDCRRYLDLGEDKISELWFSKECKAFGVIKTYDRQIQEYREVALEITEKNADDTESITCPACGKIVVEDRNEFILNGFIFCKGCGKLILNPYYSQMKNSDESTPYY